MSRIDLGCNFSDEHVDTILDIVKAQEAENRPHRVVGVYGTPKGESNPFGSTRPRGRETEVTDENFLYNLIRLRDAGLEINLTINMVFPYIRTEGPDANIFNQRYVQDKMRDMFINYGQYVESWIMSSPFLIDFYHQIGPLGAGIKISTIMNVHGLKQMQEIKERWPRVTAVCPSIWMNRDFEWLSRANEIIPLELLANEFCSIGGAECDGLYRQACYLSQNMEVEWNPMKAACIESRADNPEAWLMARFILPQWIKDYRLETGVDRFKVTGRTHTPEYIKYIGDVYTKGTCSGNLLQLWGQLEATFNKEDQQHKHEDAVDKTVIDIEDVENLLIGFRNCDITRCGVTCQFCKQMAKDLFADKD
jgi:collagenase-like PrtC family protease